MFILSTLLSLISLSTTSIMPCQSCPVADGLGSLTIEVLLCTNQVMQVHIYFFLLIPTYGFTCAINLGIVPDVLDYSIQATNVCNYEPQQFFFSC